MRDKLTEKQEKLKQLEKKNDKERQLIMKKLEKIQLKKLSIDKMKEENLLRLKSIRDTRFEKAKINKSMLEIKEKERIENILFGEEERFDRVLHRENKVDNMKSFSRYQTIGYQKEKDKKMKYYIKQRNLLQNESIIKKTLKQRRQIYINKLKKEAEERRKEEEKRLEQLGLI